MVTFMMFLYYCRNSNIGLSCKSVHVPSFFLENDCMYYSRLYVVDLWKRFTAVIFRLSQYHHTPSALSKMKNPPSVSGSANQENAPKHLPIPSSSSAACHPVRERENAQSIVEQILEGQTTRSNMVSRANFQKK